VVGEEGPAHARASGDQENADYDDCCDAEAAHCDQESFPPVLEN